MERWTSRRASPPLASASAPSTHVIPSPTHAVSTAPSATVDGRGRGRSHPPAQSRAHPLEADREHHPRDQRSDQAEGRRPRRAAAVVEQQRADPRAHVGADREPDQRERARDESLRPAEQAEQHHDAHDQPVDAGHVHPSVPASPYSPVVEHDAGTAHVAGDAGSPTLGASPRSPRRRCVALVAGVVDRRRATCRAEQRDGRRPSRRPGSAATHARDVRAALATTARRRTTLAAAAAHLPAGGGDAHARAGPRGPVDRRRHASRSRSRPASSARCEATCPPHRRAQGRRTRASTGAPSSSTPACAAARSCGARPRCPQRATIQARDGTPIAKGPERVVGSRTDRLRDRRARSGPRRRSPPAAARGPRRPAGAPVGPDRPRARVRRAPDRHARRRRCSPATACSPTSSAKRRPLGADHDRPEDPARRGRRARRPLRRDRGRATRATARCWRWPGSPSRRRSRPARTFKIVTLAGVLENKVAKRSGDLPDPERGRRSRASRSRTPTASPAAARCATRFAHSCNSVFAPLGAKLGAEKLVETAETFGFNEEPRTGRRGALDDPRRGRDRRRPRGRLVRDRPGQGARDAAADGARRRRRSAPTACARTRRCSRAPTRSACARRRSRSRRTIKSYMRTVVTDGTGGAAALAGVKVAGKTGTAELRTTVKEEPPPEVTDPDAAAARGRHDRHRRLVRRVRALRQADDRGRGAARRPGRGRRHRRARGRCRPEGRAVLEVEVDLGRLGAAPARSRASAAGSAASRS